jgi:hypothetical protein
MADLDDIREGKKFGTGVSVKTSRSISKVPITCRGGQKTA